MEGFNVKDVYLNNYHTILGVLFYIYSIMGPETLF